jgi:hypothetical protein
MRTVIIFGLLIFNSCKFRNLLWWWSKNKMEAFLTCSNYLWRLIFLITDRFLIFFCLLVIVLLMLRSFIVLIIDLFFICLFRNLLILLLVGVLTIYQILEYFFNQNTLKLFLFNSDNHHIIHSLDIVFDILLWTLNRFLA